MDRSNMAESAERVIPPLRVDVVQHIIEQVADALTKAAGTHDATAGELSSALLTSLQRLLITLVNAAPTPEWRERNRMAALKGLTQVVDSLVEHKTVN